jgi:hydrogenase maturation protease
LVLCIAIGNPLRGDDGVAHHVLELLPQYEQMRVLEVIQLMPELASEITGADAVIFLDADASVTEVTFEVVSDYPTRSTRLLTPQLRARCSKLLAVSTALPEKRCCAAFLPRDSKLAKG